MTQYTEETAGGESVVGRSFNAANQLLTSSDKTAGTTRYNYDSNGAMTQISAPNNVTSYSYNQRNLLLETTRQVGSGPTPAVARPSVHSAPLWPVCDRATPRLPVSSHCC